MIGPEQAESIEGQRVQARHEAAEHHDLRDGRRIRYHHHEQEKLAHNPRFDGRHILHRVQ